MLFFHFLRINVFAKLCLLFHNKSLSINIWLHCIIMPCDWLCVQTKNICTCVIIKQCLSRVNSIYYLQKYFLCFSYFHSVKVKYYVATQPAHTFHPYMSGVLCVCFVVIYLFIYCFICFSVADIMYLNFIQHDWRKYYNISKASTWLQNKSNGIAQERKGNFFCWLCSTFLHFLFTYIHFFSSLADLIYHGHVMFISILIVTICFYFQMLF